MKMRVVDEAVSSPRRIDKAEDVDTSSTNQDAPARPFLFSLPPSSHTEVEARLREISGIRLL